MATRMIAGRELEVDEQGHLADPGTWTPQIAEELAREAGIAELTPAHWRIIEFCRADARSQGQSPGVRRICQHLGLPTRDLYLLFPRGPGRLAALIAGQPKPAGCV
jgi:tRNA 2-thiouridine synthesizing protein E